MSIVIKDFLFQIKQAELHNVGGALLYADPADTKDHHLSVCDHWVPYATANDGVGGDPVTPGFPAYGMPH